MKSLRNNYNNKHSLHIQTEHNAFISMSPTYSPRHFFKSTSSSPSSPYTSSYKHHHKHHRKTISLLNTKHKKNEPFRLIMSDKEMLTTYYKTTQEDEQKYHHSLNHKNKLTQSEKVIKHDLLKRYRIRNKFDYSHDKDLPLLTDNNLVSIHIKQPYFKSFTKAKKTLQINEQLANTITKLTQFMQMKTYTENIKKQTQANEALDKMPHIRVKKTECNNIKLDKNEQLRKGSNNNNNNSNNNGNKRKSISLACFIANANGKHIPSNIIIKHISNINITYSVSTYKRAFKPTSRAMFTLNVYRNRLYLFGGLNSIYNNDIWMYSLHTKKWEEIKLKEHPIPRYGHTSIQINEYLIIFGGQIPDNYFNTHEDILFFNLLTHTFIEQKIHSKTKPTNRKGHIALAISQTMFIHGGIETDNYNNNNNTNYNYLSNDAYIYQLNKNTWNVVETEGETLPYLAYHSAVFVNYFSLGTSTPYSIYKLPEDLPNNRVKRAKIEGIYLFGGVNERQRFNNELYVIKICRKPCKVVKPKVKGVPPKGRINCKMIFIAEFNMVIVHGGCGERQEVLNDIMILNLESLDWLRPKCDDEDGFDGINRIDLKYRTEHDVFMVNGKIYILGGRNADNYLKMDFEIVSFNVSE